MKNRILFAALLCSTISYAQNVGIGTASPTNKLDVNGSVRLRETTYAVSGPGPNIAIATDVSQAQLTAGASPSGIATISTTTPQDGQLLAIYNNSGIPATLNGQTIPTGRAASFVYSATGWRSISDPNLDWKLTGNTGTTPSIAAIGSAVTAGSNFIGTTDAKDLVIATSNFERMRVTSAGNVGIGTTAVGQRLTVVDAGNANQYNGTFSVYANNLTQGVGIGYAGIQALGSNTNQDLSFNARGTGNITMQVSGTTGNVGIGTTSPGATLNVIHLTSSTTPTKPTGNWAAIIENNQDATDSRNGLSVVTRWGGNTSKIFEAASYWTGSAQAYTPILTVLGDRTVGISTTSPGAKLHVAANESDGIDIGKPNDNMGSDGGNNAIRFYGYRDVRNNFIGAKITSERTNACCTWASQGNDLAFYTLTAQPDAAPTSPATPSDLTSERMRIKSDGTITVANNTPIRFVQVTGLGDNPTVSSFQGTTFPVANWTPALVGLQTGGACGSNFSTSSCVCTLYPLSGFKYWWSSTTGNSSGNWQLSMDMTGLSDGCNTIQVMFVRSEISSRTGYGF